ncbi:DUF2946 domain-containing protein [Allohahella sp. A8]|uniref:DUF2946 domain-containing protein n=1 Tax=Allohahella sp. A8 TaxID=3141461 RepID=UPI003A7FB996
MKAPEHRRLTCWLALLSILLIYLGPILTQLQFDASRDQTRSTPSSLTDSADFAARSKSGHAHHPPQHHAPQHHADAQYGHHDQHGAHERSRKDPPLADQHVSHADCGYCALLTKVPPNLAAAMVSVAFKLDFVQPLLPRTTSLPREAPVFPDAPVRAPPALA